MQRLTLSSPLPHSGEGADNRLPVSTGENDESDRLPLSRTTTVAAL